jgi:hypothetical protein
VLLKVLASFYLYQSNSVYRKDLPLENIIIILLDAFVHTCLGSPGSTKGVWNAVNFVVKNNICVPRVGILDPPHVWHTLESQLLVKLSIKSISA